MENKFIITDEMRKRSEEHKSSIESKYLDYMRNIWVKFCEEFNTIWNFDMWGNPDGDMLLNYTAYIWGETVVIDGDIRWKTIDEFLDFIEGAENTILEDQEKIKEEKENKETMYKMIAELHEYIQNWLYFWDLVEYEYILEKLQDMQNLCN